MSRKWIGAVLPLALSATLAAQTKPVEKIVEKQVVRMEPGAGPERAVAQLHAVGASGVTGTATFVREGDAVRVKVEVSGLTPGKHGFHIHEFGDCSAPDASSAGGHFNPTGHDHADADAPKRHVGDLGNLTADASGKATLDRLDSVLKLAGPSSILGRGLIVHAGEDDLKTQPTGNAGGRVACAVIGVGK